MMLTTEHDEIRQALPPNADIGSMMNLWVVNARTERALIARDLSRGA